jgi:MscS family membrane protein
MKSLLHSFSVFYSQFTLLFTVLMYLFIGLVLHFLLNRILRKMHYRLKRSRFFWDGILIKSVRKPLLCFLWLVLFLILGDIINQHTVKSYVAVLAYMRGVGFSIILVWFLWRFVSKFEKAYIKQIKGKKSRSDVTTVMAIGKLLRIVTIILAVLIFADSVGVPFSGVIAMGGGGALAVGIAAKDILANFFGGVIIHLERPFTVGDWIYLADKPEVQGTVEMISWRVTRIRTFDRRPMYVPNMYFVTSFVVNPQRMLNRRILANFGVRYDDAKKVDKIVSDVDEMLKTHPGIDHSPGSTRMVNFLNFGASSLDIQIYAFTSTKVWKEYRKVQQEVFIRVLEIVQDNGAEFAFPTTTVHVPEPVNVHAQPGISGQPV